MLIITQRNAKFNMLIDIKLVNILQSIKNITLKLSFLLDRNPQVNT